MDVDDDPGGQRHRVALGRVQGEAQLADLLDRAGGDVERGLARRPNRRAPGRRASRSGSDRPPSAPGRRSGRRRSRSPRTAARTPRASPSRSCRPTRSPRARAPARGCGPPSSRLTASLVQPGRNFGSAEASPMTMRRIRLAVLAFAALAALVTGAAAGAVREPVAGGAQAQRAGSGELAQLPSSCRVPRSALHAGSHALGSPSRGRLVNGVPFRRDGLRLHLGVPHRDHPSPERRRWGTEKLVLTLQCVLSDYGERHPEHARVGVAVSHGRMAARSVAATPGPGPLLAPERTRRRRPRPPVGPVRMPGRELVRRRLRSDAGADRRVRGDGSAIRLRLPLPVPPGPAARAARRGHPAALPRHAHARADQALAAASACSRSV